MKMSESSPQANAHTNAQVVIVVVRSGGIAGMRRHWQVEADPQTAGAWIDLIDRCPWDQTTDTDEGADRFVWSIEARTPSERRESELNDSQIDGPWLALVDAVRDAARRKE